ncbi:hypothetical protein IGJ55_002719 [Enterococcus sp. AZ170]|uniref:LPXTG cell wall anchor domain-containing protein n=1 Tax=Enterococcus sp. AZ170 TaxID=2774747 RepID=UPI003D2FDAEB
MKKKLSLLGVTLLCSSALATTVTLPSKVFAEGASTSDSTSTNDLVAQLQAVIDGAKPYVDYTKYEKGPVDTLNMYIGFAESDITNGYISETTLPGHIDAINSALELVKSSPLDVSEPSSTESTNSSTSESESSSTESTSASTSESESSSTESTSSSISESESSSTESTSSSTSESESSSTDSTSSSTSEELKPTINVSDKTMYVGDKLTEEDILNWATFENVDGLKIGFEVIGDPIQVYKVGNTLAEPGVHQIRYYVEATTRASQKRYLAEETITLTINNRGITDTTSSTTTSSSSSTGITNTTSSPGAYTKPTGKTTPISSASAIAGLPQTGETNSPLLTVIGSMALLAGGAYVLTLKRKKSN